MKRRELNILVVEQVLGRVPCGEWTPTHRPVVGWQENCQCPACYPAGHPADYSSNIAAAWEVVEHLAESRIYLCLLDQMGYAVDEAGKIASDCVFRAEFMDAKAHERGEGRVWYGVVEAETAPLAICLAAMKTVRRKDD